MAHGVKECNERLVTCHPNMIMHLFKYRALQACWGVGLHNALQPMQASNARPYMCLQTTGTRIVPLDATRTKSCVPGGTSSIRRACQRDRAGIARPYPHLRTSTNRQLPALCGLRVLQATAYRIQGIARINLSRNDVGAGTARPIGFKTLQPSG